MANSKIERVIDEIEDFLSRCKNQPLSNNKIIVTKDELNDLITSLRKATAEELDECNKIRATQKEIISKAKHDAEKLYNEAAAKTSEMINQNSIMQQAYAQADQVVKEAYAEASDMIYLANAEANNVKTAAVEYLDSKLAQFESVVVETMNLTQSHYESFYSKLNFYHDEIVSNRMELYPQQNEQEQATEADSDPSKAGINNTGALGNTSPLNGTGSLSNTGSITNTGALGNTGSLTSTGTIKIGNQDGTDGDGDIKLM